jgi:hypothetical protein
MAFSPFAFELILAALYLMLRAIYEIRLHRWYS